MHTRFEHSIGVMRVATLMFDAIVKRRSDFLKDELHFNDEGLARDRILVRISSLLHDVGHAPFSHAAEELMDKDPAGKAYKHENYSAAAVAFLMKDVIDNHPSNQNYGITAKDVSDFLDGSTSLGRRRLWRDLVSSQLDADRADYLLRDSLHIGVAYGRFDLSRLLVTLTVAIDPELGSPVLAVEKGGEHAAEALILARYMMFTQVYFHNTRRAYDFHLAQALRHLLIEDSKDRNLSGQGVFPPPDSAANVKKYLDWDDWRALGRIREERGGEHGKIILERKHHRCIHQTPEAPSRSDLEFMEEIKDKLGEIDSFPDRADNSWYKFDNKEIPIVLRPGRPDEDLTPLSGISSVVRGLRPVSLRRLYVPFATKDEALEIIEAARRERKTSKEIGRFD